MRGGLAAGAPAPGRLRSPWATGPRHRLPRQPRSVSGPGAVRSPCPAPPSRWDRRGRAQPAKLTAVRVAGALIIAPCREIRLSVRILRPKLKCAMSYQLTKAYEFVLRTTKELLCFYQGRFGNRLCFFGNSDIAVVRQTHHEPDELWDAVLCRALYVNRNLAAAAR